MARRMSKRRIRWNVPGFQDVRHLPGVERVIAQKVWAVQNAAEAADWGNYEGGTEDGGDRVRGYVVTADFAAIQDEASRHTLQRALASIQSGTQDPGAALIEYTTRAGKVRMATQAQVDAWTAQRKESR